MSTHPRTKGAVGHGGLRAYLRALGPGVVTGASDDDPSGVATYAQAGARYRFGLLWLTLVTFPLMCAVQEICDRTALATGESLGRLVDRRFSRRGRIAVGVMLVALVGANILNIAADLLAIGEGMSLLHLGPVALAALGLDDPTVVVGNFDRPEIHLEVVTFHDADDKRAAVVERAAGTTGPGLVYVATRAHAEEVAEALAAAGRQAEAYHAGLGDKVRRSTQDRFLSGDLDVVVATNAFGMGIDKPDIRFVLHHDVPGSVDAYYQEIGRAGRDGEPAEAVLFWRSEDLDLQRYFAGGSVDTGALGQVAQAVHDAGGDTTRDDLAEATGLGDRALSRALNLLAGGGALDLDGAGQVSAGGADAAAVIAEVARQDEERHEVERSRVAMVRAYAEGRSCRRGFVLNYFGQDFDPPCGNCDVCCSDRGAAPEAGELADELPVGCVVGHREWGKGRVVRHDEDTVTVLFDDAGYKVLSAPLVRERGLLVPDVAVR